MVQDHDNKISDYFVLIFWATSNTYIQGSRSMPFIHHRLVNRLAASIKVANFQNIVYVRCTVSQTIYNVKHNCDVMNQLLLQTFR
jgi:hypothetical protein